MAKDSQEYTAFTVGSMGVYEFLRMPYGLCNAPATFQRLMQNCLGELNLTYTLIYLDDVIVFSRTEEEHLHRLRVVFARFLEHGLKLKPSKCHFLQDEITFLGHEVSAEGMKPGTANLKAIAEMAPPKTYTEIRRCTGMMGFFRWFIKGYSKIAKPLNDLLEGEASKLKAEEVELPPDALKAFEELKLRCMTAPVLVFADFKKPFQLETDASKEGLGAVLLQESDDGQYHPVAFASRELKGGEPKYHSPKLEFLALKWAITEQFHSRMTKSGVGSRLQFLAFGLSALSERGSLSDRSLGGCFPRAFSRCCEPELEALLEGWETRLVGAHFRRLVIESSWSPKESTGPVDFFQHFSSSLRASASSFPLASSFQNNPVACLADWCGFFPESGVVFAAPGGGKLDLVGVCEEPGMFWHAGMAVIRSTKDAGQLAEQL